MEVSRNQGYLLRVYRGRIGGEGLGFPRKKGAILNFGVAIMRTMVY